MSLLNTDAASILKFGTELLTFGYGLTAPNIYKNDGLLRFSELIVVGTPRGDVGANFIAFSPLRAGVTHGDSGGPVTIIRDNTSYLVGINSSAGNDGHLAATVPQKHVHWIADTINQLVQSQ